MSKELFAFISQPMKGKTNDEIFNERQEVVKFLEDCGYTVLNSIITENPPINSNEGLYYLGESLKILSKANTAYFMDKWYKARGCIIEHDSAVAYGIHIIHD